jgi:hypothetical protein
MHRVIFVLLHIQMFKLTLLLRAIALCFFFHAHRIGGVRLCPTIQEVIQLYTLTWYYFTWLAYVMYWSRNKLFILQWHKSCYVVLRLDRRVTGESIWDLRKETIWVINKLGSDGRIGLDVIGDPKGLVNIWGCYWASIKNILQFMSTYDLR